MPRSASLLSGTWPAVIAAVAGGGQNWLIGFSKSGLGGQGLIFRNPGTFTACASHVRSLSISAADQAAILGGRARALLDAPARAFA